VEYNHKPPDLNVVVKL